MYLFVNITLFVSLDSDDYKDLKLSVSLGGWNLVYPSNKQAFQRYLEFVLLLKKTQICVKPEF